MSKSIGQFWNRYKKQIVLVLKGILFFLLCYNIYSKFSGEEFEDTLRVFREEFSFSKIHFLLLAIFLTFFNWAFETLKYYITIQKVEKLSYFKAYRGILYGNALNMVLPASLGDLTGRPLVLQYENRVQGSGVAYYVSIVQKVASPFVGLVFLFIAYQSEFLTNQYFEIQSFKIELSYFLVLIGIVDISIWLWLFLFPEKFISVFERFKSIRKYLLRMKEVVHYNVKTKLSLLAIGAFRFLIFVAQYWILMFLFFDNFQFWEFFVLCGVYFLAQFVFPSMGFLDVGIRANLVVFIFSKYLDNFLQLMAVNYLIWIINLFVPSLFGFYLMRKANILLEDVE